MIPGAEEVLALLELRAQARVRASGTWSSSTARPTAETLRLLALPEALGWYMDRVLRRSSGAWSRRCARCSTRAAGVPMPEDAVFDAVERLHARPRGGAAAAHRAGRQRPAGADARDRRGGRGPPLATPRCRSTATASTASSPTGSSRRTGADAWRAGWVAAQARVLAEVEQSFAGLPALALGVPARRAGRASTALRRLRRAQAYDGDDPLGVADGDGPDHGSPARRRVPCCGSRCRSSTRADVDLARHGDELVVTVGSYRRLLTAARRRSRRHAVAGARRGGRRAAGPVPVEQEERP